MFLTYGKYIKRELFFEYESVILCPFVGVKRFLPKSDLCKEKRLRL